MKSFPSQISCKVSYLCFKIDLSCCFRLVFFLSFRKLTILACLVCSLLFHPGDVAEWNRYGSCLLSQANIFRLGLCLVRIALKLRRFRKPTMTFIGSKSIAHHIPHKYLASYHKPVFIGLKCRCGLHPKLKELLYSKK